MSLVFINFHLDLIAKFPFFNIFDFLAISDFSVSIIITLPFISCVYSWLPQLGHLSPSYILLQCLHAFSVLILYSPVYYNLHIFRKNEKKDIFHELHTAFFLEVGYICRFCFSESLKLKQAYLLFVLIFLCSFFLSFLFFSFFFFYFLNC